MARTRSQRDTGRITIQDLAGRLGLSAAAVSYALNGQPGVSEQTRARVKAMAEELGWHPSSSARALSSARADVIGVVLSRDPSQIGAETYYMQVIAGIESILADSDVSLLLRMVGTEPGRDLRVYERWAAERRVDGFILFDEKEDDVRIPLMRRLGLPAVLQGGPAQDDHITSVRPHDDAIDVIDHLHELGHRHVVHISGPQRYLHEQRRLEDLTQRAALAGISLRHLEGDYTTERGRELALRALHVEPVPTALVFSSDLMAIGGFQAAAHLRLQVPGDVSLVSWDDSILCALTAPGITAVERHAAEHGRRSALALLAVIGGYPVPYAQNVTSELVVRGSTGPVATR